LTQGSRSVRIWDAKTGNSLGSIDVPDEGPGFWTSSLTPDGQSLLTTRRNGTAQVWSLAERKLLRSFPLAAPPFDLSGKCDAVHASDGSAIAVVTGDGSLRVCDVASGRERDDLRSHSDGITAVAFTADSKFLLVATHGRELKFWDMASGQVVNAPGVKERLVRSGRLLETPSDKNVSGTPLEAQKIVLSAAEPPMAAIIAAPKTKEGGEDRSKLILNSWSDSRNIGGVMVAASSSGIIVGDAHAPLAITPDGRYVLANNPPSTYLGQWDVRSHRNIRQYSSGAYAASAIAFTADGRTMITADSRMHFWDWKTGQPADDSAVSPKRFIGEFQSFVLSADGQTAVMAESDGSLVARELTTGRMIRRFEYAGDPPRTKGTIRALALSGNQELVAAVIESTSVDESGFASATVYVWNFKTGEIQHRIGSPPHRHLAFSPDGRFLAASSPGANFAGTNLSARFWDMATSLEQSGPADTQFGSVIDYSSDGKKLLAFYPPQVRVKIISEDNKKVLENWAPQLPGQLTRWAYTPDLKSFAFAWGSGGGDSGITFFRGQERLPLPLRFDRPNQFPILFALSADGSRLAGVASGESPEVTIWDVATGRELRRFTGLRGQGAGLAFTPDGKRLVAGSTDGTLLVFDVAQ
jgi:WD40 repeat protein